MLEKAWLSLKSFASDHKNSQSTFYIIIIAT
jgi:hypothetical protein